MTDVIEIIEETIVLVATGDSFWLLEGETHLSAMLSAEAPYPTPVLCRTYESVLELQMDMVEGILVGNLWAIHPAIVERLHKLEHIVIEEK